MPQVPRLMQRSRSFESLCGPNPTEFTLLADQREPLLTRAHCTPLLREGRRRRIGAGRQFKLDVPHRLLLTLTYLRHHLPMHLLGVLFEMDAAPPTSAGTSMRSCHSWSRRCLLPSVPGRWTSARSRPTTRGVVGCASCRTCLKRSRRLRTSSLTAPNSPEGNPRRSAVVPGRKPWGGLRTRRSFLASRRAPIR
ncbi:transposase family protein [Deinococcus aquaticus]|uniref:transposase family protein n=1 Tax=Deinococcus aquaticus TaxID=328692 RepID=UPI003618E4D9